MGRLGDSRIAKSCDGFAPLDSNLTGPVPAAMKSGVIRQAEEKLRFRITPAIWLRVPFARFFGKPASKWLPS